MQVKRTAECSPWSILQYFDLHLATICHEDLCFVFLGGDRFTPVWLCYMYISASTPEVFPSVTKEKVRQIYQLINFLHRSDSK